MNNQEITPKEEAFFVTKISARNTLLSLNIGEPVLIPSKRIKAGTLRVAASRLEKEKSQVFYYGTRIRG